MNELLIMVSIFLTVAIFTGGVLLVRFQEKCFKEANDILTANWEKYKKEEGL